MKSVILLLLSFFLVAAVLAPSIITLINSGERTAIAIDFNEDEKKEEKKEVNEKDFFMNFNFKLSLQSQQERTAITNFYIESEYATSISIFLQPPKVDI